MLDHVSISHESGLILWSRSFNPTFLNLASTSRSPVNSLVRDVIMENKAIVAKGEEQGLDSDGFSVRWTLENGLGLVFVVVFPALLPLTYIPELLLRMKQLFISLFHPYIEALVSSLHTSSASAVVSDTLKSLQSQGQSALIALKQQIDLEKWEAIFERCLKGCEERASGGQRKMMTRSAVAALSKKARISAAEAISSPGTGDTPSATSDTENQGQPAVSAEEIAKNVQALKGRLKGGKAGGSGRRGGTPSPAASPARSAKGSSGSATNKVLRKWNDTTSTVSQADMDQLDFSGPDGHADAINGSGTDTSANNVDLDALVSSSAMGKVGNDGLYEVADWDTGRKEDGSGIASEEEILASGRKAYPALFGEAASDGKHGLSASNSATAVAGDLSDLSVAVTKTKSGSALSSLFSRFTGTKILSKQDLEPVLAEMEKHLMSKNVAKDIAEKICEGVGAALVGKKVGGMASIKSEVNAALSSTITQILTSKSSTDILLDIKRKASRPQTDATALREPYIMTFIGVNGVGKSTNLSKVCFWLLQNELRVLIAACDTFRSGAVEQLRVHVRNLGLLGQELGRANDGSDLPRVELYERGYGKDAAGIAKDAIAYAKEHQFEVVLVDTAGRMQDNEPLMRALAKLVAVNSPDKIIFVGEALVGNEAVDQLSKFDRALRDFTSSVSTGNSGTKGKARGIDGMILTKFDTIDDKVGAALSMTYITGQPILFVGCGQTYTDLRHLKVNHIVQALLSE
ncbi:hypothetical protein QFC21_007000 [Naganishia friedmannii]|uniref:Uncharacterized protein n=1 Tax=Naganishia friedmannii TaxID=89922 RepID=A0ACC2UY71_9TREE|nr:hypothetical protein QFC21_007000 [Naganishia friedmannii]